MSYNKKLIQKLLKVLKRNSVVHGRIILSSGQKSSYYIDAKMTSLDSYGIVLAGKLFASQLKGIDSIGGPTLGADPFTGAVLYECWKQKRHMRGFIVRKKTKGHGTKKLIEGPFKKGDKTVVIEDVITTGKSVYEAIKTVEHLGGKVIKVLILVDREEGGKEFLEKRGYPVFPICTKSDLGL